MMQKLIGKKENKIKPLNEILWSLEIEKEKKVKIFKTII